MSRELGLYYAIQDQVTAYQDVKREIREKINLDEISKEAGEAEIKVIDDKITALRREGKRSRPMRGLLLKTESSKT